MSFTRKLVAAAFALALCSQAAEEKQDEKKKEPPKVTAVIPFALATGTTNTFTVRGLNLTNATALRFLSYSNLPARIKSRGPAKVPDKADAKKAGDTQLEVELALPDDFPPGELSFVVETPEGGTSTNQLQVAKRELLFNEKEPNGSFRKPNEIKLPQTILGTTATVADVDVFRFEARAGEKLHLETLTRRHGSALDPIVTLHDLKGHTLTTRDDSAGSSDPSFDFTVPADGAYLVSIMDAHDRGGENYGYLLLIRRK
jgi:hypothetical protein